MSSHAGRNEYVLSEVGKVYAGTHNKIAGKDSVDFYYDSTSNYKYEFQKKHAIIEFLYNLYRTTLDFWTAS